VPLRRQSFTLVIHSGNNSVSEIILFLAPPVSFDFHILFFVSKISHISPYGCETLYLQTKTLLHKKSQSKQKTPKLHQKIIHIQCHLLLEATKIFMVFSPL